METKAITQVGEVILTEEAMQQLKNFQKSGNTELNSAIEDLAEIVCLGNIIIDQIEPAERNDQMQNAIINLSYLREKLITLRKP